MHFGSIDVNKEAATQTILLSGLWFRAPQTELKPKSLNVHRPESLEEAETAGSL